VAAARRLTFALAGQPNVGKSTVFNALTGLNQHVGNWPGKTVEKKTGRFTRDGRTFELVDLPGTYSLASGSEEERVARDYLIREKPDAVIAIVNASSLERNLYLVAELLALPVPVVVGLNMLDVAEQHGVSVEPKVLEAALGLPVVELVASKRRGIDELVEAAVGLIERPGSFAPNRPVIRANTATSWPGSRASSADANSKAIPPTGWRSSFSKAMPMRRRSCVRPLLISGILSTRYSLGTKTPTWISRAAATTGWLGWFGRQW
jgi:small GTP-binding protein